MFEKEKEKEMFANIARILLRFLSSPATIPFSFLRGQETLTFTLTLCCTPLESRIVHGRCKGLCLLRKHHLESLGRKFNVLILRPCPRRQSHRDVATRSPDRFRDLPFHQFGQRCLVSSYPRGAHRV